MSEAAEMYERAGQFERAASIYIQAKNFTAAAPLMQRISSSKLHLQFAKAKEAEGRWVCVREWWWWWWDCGGQVCGGL